MVTEASTSAKRGPTSPVEASKTKKKRTTEVAKLSKEINTHIGWLEQFAHTERTKKLTIAGHEGIMERTRALRDVFSDLCLEANRLGSRSQLTQEQLKAMMNTYSEALLEKTAEIQKLQRENEELRAEIQAREEADELAEVRPATQTVRPSTSAQTRETASYAEMAKLDPKPGQPRAKGAKNSSKSAKKKTLMRCREVKTSSRLTFEVPAGGTIASAKAELWATVKGRMNNPRAKTLVKDNQLIIIPDDGNTFEVISKLPNVSISGPRQPRVIIYDIDSELTDGEIVDGLINQNPELGLSQEDIDRLSLKHRLGPRNSSTTHKVLEVHASTLPKIEGKQVYLGLTRCRVKLYQSMPQCFNCQKHGHTALRCKADKPTCKYCVGPHDSRNCDDKSKTKCANCRQEHQASSSTCKSRETALRSLLRRTDFGHK
ncbi:unnamed protein product [Macrosiphum euphorbiae]|nr:unnamed protein product [Macrosiphum euphorbiae]